MTAAGSSPPYLGWLDRLPESWRAEVSATVLSLTAAMRRIFAETLIGIYVHGSVGAGAFRAATSDLDLMVVVRGAIPAGAAGAIAAWYAAAADEAPRVHGRIEIVWASLALLNGDEATGNVVEAHKDEGVKVEPVLPDLRLMAHSVREHGIAVIGPNPGDLLAPMTAAGVLRAQRGTLEAFWRPQLADPSRFRAREWQVFAVVTMCRALCTLDRGELATKPDAVAWSQSHLDEPWRSLVRRAASWPDAAREDELQLTLDFVRHVLVIAGDRPD